MNASATSGMLLEYDYLDFAESFEHVFYLNMFLLGLLNTCMLI